MRCSNEHQKFRIPNPTTIASRGLMKLHLSTSSEPDCSKFCLRMGPASLFKGVSTWIFSNGGLRNERVASLSRRSSPDEWRQEDVTETLTPASTFFSGLIQEERPLTLIQKYHRLGKDPTSMIKIALFETNSQWNRGRSDVAKVAVNDSWEKIYCDFFEVKVSTEALSRRVDKIQDGIISLILGEGEQ
jgi:hypothetical protein